MWSRPGWTLPYYALISAWLAGMFALCWGLRRGSGCGRPRSSARRLPLAIEGVVANNAYFIASSGIFLLGGIDAAVSIYRGVSSDDEVPI